MYSSLLVLHNLWRWVVLILCVTVVIGSFLKLVTRKSWTPTDRALGLALVIAVDIQFVFGLLLFGVFSPLTRAALANLGSAMQSKELRFFTIEHTFLMICFLALVHIGNARVRRALDDRDRHRSGLIWWGASLLVLLVGIPWWRPLLRL